LSLIAHNTIQNMYIDAMNPSANTVPPINSKANRSLYGMQFHKCFIMLTPFHKLFISESYSLVYHCTTKFAQPQLPMYILAF